MIDFIGVLFMLTRISVLIVILIVMLTSFAIMANKPFTFDFNNTTGTGLEFHSFCYYFNNYFYKRESKTYLLFLDFNSHSIYTKRVWFPLAFSYAF